MSAPAAAGAVATDATPNLLHVQFKDPEFLSYLSHLQSTGQVAPPSDGSKFDPNHPLTEHNVMAYFATSPFFDRRSNNEQIRMQNIANGIQNLTGGMGARQEEEELKRFTGLEFVLVHSRAPLCFVLQKRWRTSATESKCHTSNGTWTNELNGELTLNSFRISTATPLAAYYIINDSIYQAPDMYSILATRLVGASTRLQHITPCRLC